MLAKDSRMREGRGGKGRKGVNAIYTMTTIVPLSFSLSPGAKCLRSAAKGREEGGEGRVVTTHRERQGIPLARTMRGQRKESRGCLSYALFGQ